MEANFRENKVEKKKRCFPEQRGIQYKKGGQRVKGNSEEDFKQTLGGGEH